MRLRIAKTLGIDDEARSLPANGARLGVWINAPILLLESEV